MIKNGWQVKEKDIQLLVKEIRHGQSYIEQATALKEAAEKSGKSLPEYKDRNAPKVKIKSEKVEVSCLLTYVLIIVCHPMYTYWYAVGLTVIVSCKLLVYRRSLKINSEHADFCLTDLTHC